jgi:hypothetical protein
MARRSDPVGLFHLGSTDCVPHRTGSGLSRRWHGTMRKGRGGSLNGCPHASRRYTQTRAGGRLRQTWLERVTTAPDIIGGIGDFTP